MRPSSLSAAWIAAPWIAAAATTVAWAQADAGGVPGPVPVVEAGADAAAEGGSEPMIELDLPESVDLQVLVDYIGKRNGINWLYNENLLVNKKVTIKAPSKLPASSLMPLLEAALKSQGLVIVPADVPGMLSLEVSGQQLPKLSDRILREGDAVDPARSVVVTRVFQLDHADATTAQRIVQPFLSVNNAVITPVPEQGLLIVTDFSDNLPRLEDLLSVLDVPGREPDVEFVTVENLPAAEMVNKVNTLLQSKARAAPGQPAQPQVSLIADDRTNQVAVVAPPEGMAEAMGYIGLLDVPLGLETRFYQFVVASPTSIDSLVQEAIGELDAARLYRSVVEPESGLLAVTTTPGIHDQIDELRGLLDQPIEEAQSPIRFYKLQNARASDVLETLGSIEGGTGLEGVTVDGVGVGPGGTEVQIRGPAGADVNPELIRPTRLATGGSVDLPDARVIADVPTNTLIVVAPPPIQAVYQRLIERLDARRPQVLIEATLVAIDTTDDFSLGVEFFVAEGGVDGGEVLTFSGLGVSALDVAEQALTFPTGTGFNTALLNAASAQVVLAALQEDDRSRVFARPRLLVNDNETGTLISNSEEPFESLNTIDGVTTVSLGGFAEAGTELQITPQISEGDHLRLEYSFIQSSFTSLGTDSLPPSRQTNEFASVATIPDGHTIVVGGLALEDFSESINRIPILGEIPILEYAFSSRDIDRSESTLFVFIKATILRDDKFADLKSISLNAANAVELDSDFPESQPIAIR